MSFGNAIHFETVGWRLLQYAEQERTFEKYVKGFNAMSPVLHTC